ncbi:Protein of unknown function DUF868, plant [Dillenia turbinata]|uniref:Uncharacterized protein n=1 Tax=Dillenia turbinata TaxID=194707 RepID=A0AAN8UUV2_9MAGN
MHDPIGVPACFTLGERPVDDSSIVTRSGQSIQISVYQTNIAGQCRLITITWCKNLLLHGLSVSVEGPEGESHYCCKVELKPWSFWRKRGSKQFIVDNKAVGVVWDLKAAKFNGETQPQSDYYVAIVCDKEVALLVGDMKKDAYRRTGCRPSLIEPIFVARKEHLFGKKKFSSRVKFEESGTFHEITIECSSADGVDSKMEISIDGQIAINVKHLQWKFRGNESIFVNKTRVEVYWDVHDWLFSPGLRNALFIFNPTSTSLSAALCNETEAENSGSSYEDYTSNGSTGFSFVLYAWKVE